MTENNWKPGDVANGHILTETDGWVPFTPPKEKHTARNIALGVVGSIAALVIIGMATDGDDKATAKDVPVSTDKPAPKATKKAEPKAEPKAAPKPKAKPDVVRVTAEQILDEFDANEAAADIKYKGKDIAVTGIVDKVDTEFWNDDEYVVEVGPGGNWVLWTVNCDDQSEETAASIEVGTKVTVTGDFEDGGDLGVEMHGCVIS